MQVSAPKARFQNGPLDSSLCLTDCDSYLELDSENGQTDCSSAIVFGVLTESSVER